MAQVTVSIDGKQYRMACDEGQEEHLTDLAERFDRYVSHLKESFGEIGDTRLTVMAALTIADELSEAGLKLRRLEEELTALQDARLVAADRAQLTQAAIVAALNAASERIEGVTRNLNQTIANGGGIAMG